METWREYVAHRVHAKLRAYAQKALYFLMVISGRTTSSLMERGIYVLSSTGR